MSKRNGNGTQIVEKAVTPASLADTVQEHLPAGAAGFASTLTLYLAHEADEFPAWGTWPERRDRMLREFWPTEPTLAGAIATLAARNMAMTWSLDGPTRTTQQVQDVFMNAEFGAGVGALFSKLSLDLYTQDNGAFMEIARDDWIDGETASKRYAAGKALPVVTSINHIDAACCKRTGDPTNPVLYIDPNSGAQRLLPWHMVVPMAEMPSPIVQARGLQYSALTRILKAAQFMRDVTIFRREKVSGRNPSQIQLVGGPSNQAIEDAKRLAAERADNQGLLRYMEPLIIASLDPTKPVSVATIEWASLPAGFDYDSELRNYITLLALALLEDYQTFAPLSGGNLGTSQQSMVLERKARGKGPGLWRKMITQMFNFYGILPRNVTFSFEESDPAAEREQAEAEGAYLANVTSALEAGILNVKVAQQMLADRGVLLDEDYLAMLGEADATPDATATDEEVLENPDTVPDLSAPAAPAAPAAVPAGMAPVAAPAAVATAERKSPITALVDEMRKAREALDRAIGRR